MTRFYQFTYVFSIWAFPFLFRLLYFFPIGSIDFILILDSNSISFHIVVVKFFISTNFLKVVKEDKRAVIAIAGLL